jgi:hypothetical protein
LSWDPRWRAYANEAAAEWRFVTFPRRSAIRYVSGSSPGWIADARNRSIPSMIHFARTLMHDIDAVRNAVTEPWSNGQALPQHPVPGKLGQCRGLRPLGEATATSPSTSLSSGRHQPPLSRQARWTACTLCLSQITSDARRLGTAGRHEGAARRPAWPAPNASPGARNASPAAARSAGIAPLAEAPRRAPRCSAAASGGTPAA